MAKKSAKSGTNGNGHTTLATMKKTSRVTIEHVENDSRLSVAKTYKIFIGGKFPRSESGRYYLLKDSSGEAIANVCMCSRKDFRDAVVAARAAQGSWGSRAAFNRSQILYRLAEMLEGRKAQFIDELIQQGATEREAKAEVALSVDRLLYYAGWADKYQQVFSSVNPVSSSHFNFSVYEPTGVVAIVAPAESGLLGLVSLVAPAIVGGNTVIVQASYELPLCAITFAEVIATSDVPGGVINILTGPASETLEHMATHMDVNAIVYGGDKQDELTTLRSKAAVNVKRVHSYPKTDFTSADAQNPYFILDLQEVKTTWHPIGVGVGDAGAKY